MPEKYAREREGLHSPRVLKELRRNTQLFRVSVGRQNVDKMEFLESFN